MTARRLKKLCYLPAYAVAIRACGTKEPFRVKYPRWNEWYADPFVCTDQGKSYVFVERMNSYHLDGEIAAAPIINGEIGDFKVVLHEPFHLSFPNVFLWRNTWYMLPESNMAGELRLYRAPNFPYDWTLDTVMWKERKLVDHALFPQDNGFLVVTHDVTDAKHRRNRMLALDMQKKKVREIFPKGSWCRERPGGTFYQEGGKWRHVIQDCQKAYGDYLHVYEVDAISETVFDEHEIGCLTADNVPFTPDNHRMEHLHTYNRDAHYEVIDLQYDKCYPDKFFIHQTHEVLKRIKGRKRKDR